jgi:biopolymer transport protein ExbD
MRVRRLKKTPAHLEITAFINLIVVLVPFLLSTAVFTRLAVIDLALPAQSSDAIFQLDKDKPLKLEIVIRHDGLQVQDRHGGSLTPIGDRIPNVAGGPTPRRWRCWCRRSRASSRSTTTPRCSPRPTLRTRRWSG